MYYMPLHAGQDANDISVCTKLSVVYTGIYSSVISLHTGLPAHVFFHFWLQAALYCAWRMHASMVQQQNTILKQEITELSLGLYPHGIY